VVVFEKGHILYSGWHRPWMDALNIVAVPGKTTPDLLRGIQRMALRRIMDEPVKLPNG